METQFKHRASHSIQEKLYQRQQKLLEQQSIEERHNGIDSYYNMKKELGFESSSSTSSSLGANLCLHAKILNINHPR